MAEEEESESPPTLAPIAEPKDQPKPDLRQFLPQELVESLMPDGASAAGFLRPMGFTKPKQPERPKSRFWPANKDGFSIVPVRFDQMFSDDEKIIVYSAMAKIMAGTCGVIFVSYDGVAEDYIDIVKAFE